MADFHHMDDAEATSTATLNPPALGSLTATARRAVPQLSQTAERLVVARARVLTTSDAPTSSWRGIGRWLNRPRRVLLALAAVWVVAVFDLGFTLCEWGTMSFVEVNPIAARLLNGPVQTVVTFKFGLLGIGTLILLGLRRHFVAELGCWFLFASKVYLAIRWYIYYDCIFRGYIDPLITIPN